MRRTYDQPTSAISIMVAPIEAPPIAQQSVPRRSRIGRREPGHDDAPDYSQRRSHAIFHPFWAHGRAGRRCTALGAKFRCAKSGESRKPEEAKPWKVFESHVP